MSNFILTEDMIDDIHQVLRNLRGRTAYKRSKLEQSAWLRSSCLVSKYLQQHPAEQPRQALKGVFTKALDQMEKEATQYARLLRLRFWEGYRVKQISSSAQLGELSSERQVYLIQQEAIRYFALILWDMEALCKREASQPPFEESLDRAHGPNFPSLRPVSSEARKYSPDYEEPPHLQKRRLIQSARPTQRELIVIALYEKGYPTRAVSEILNIAEHTVRNHLAAVRSKTDARSITEAIFLVRWAELITPNIETEVETLIEEWWRRKGKRQAGES